MAAIDVGRRDFFIAATPGFQDQVDPTWFEGWRANVAYNNMPIVESFEEFRLFNEVQPDPDFNPVENLTDEYLPFYEDLMRAKNVDHFNYLKMRVDRANARRATMARSHWSATLAGGITDPLFLTTFVPGLNAIGLGKTIVSAAGRATALGFGYGVASEARRAPFAVADEDYESAMNIATSTAISGFFGGALKGAGYMTPFIKSTAAKVGRVARGEKINHIWSGDGVNLDSGYVGQSGGDFDAVVGNPLGSPSQRMLSDPAMPQSVKEMFVNLTYNSSVPLQGNRSGLAAQSVSQLSAPYEGLVRRVEVQMRDFHAQHLGVGDEAVSIAGVYSPFTREFDDFVADTFKRYILSDAPDPAMRRAALDGISDPQREAIKVITKLFGDMGEDAKFYGLFPGQEQITKKIANLNQRIDDKAKVIADIESKRRADGTLSAKANKTLLQLEAEQVATRGRIDMLEDALTRPPRRDFKFGIYYNKELLLSDDAAREGLTRKFEDHYFRQRMQDENLSYAEAKAGYSESVREDAERTLKRILEEDADDLEDLMPANDIKGGSKHLAHRKTNIPEHEILEYMHLSMDAVHAYVTRMGKQIAFAQKFGGRNIDEVLADMTQDMEKAGLSTKKIADARTAFVGDYSRVMGTFRRNPDRFDNQMAQAAKGITAWSYLPLAGVSAVTDFASIALAHGFKDVFRAGKAGLADFGYAGGVLKEAQFAGEVLDVTRAVHQREMVSDSVKRINPTKTEKFVSIGNSAFYTLNGLAPITFAGKFLDQLVVNNRFITMSRKMAAGKLDKYNSEYLRRYGIDEEFAEYISKMPVSKHKSMQMFYANTDEWPANTPQERAKIRQYQAATAAHANNTIIMGQTFDKPLMIDGIVYMRDNAFFRMMRKKYPELYKIDRQASYKDVQLVRLESGAMTLPFTFMNFAFGANNKILNAIRDPNRKHRLQGAAALIGLSYLSLSIKKSDYWFENRDSPEILARVIDHSGLVGIYSDLGYMGLSMAVNGGLLPEEGVLGIKPKYVSPNKEERMMDALTEPFGAPAGLALSYGRAAGHFLNGRYDEGTSEFFYNAPFLGLPYIRDDAKALLDIGR